MAMIDSVFGARVAGDGAYAHLRAGAAPLYVRPRTGVVPLGAIGGTDGAPESGHIRRSVIPPVITQIAALFQKDMANVLQSGNLMVGFPDESTALQQCAAVLLKNTPEIEELREQMCRQPMPPPAVDARVATDELDVIDKEFKEHVGCTPAELLGTMNKVMTYLSGSVTEAYKAGQEFQDGVRRWNTIVMTFMGDDDTSPDVCSKKDEAEIIAVATKMCAHIALPEKAKRAAHTRNHVAELYNRVFPLLRKFAPTVCGVCMDKVVDSYYHPCGHTICGTCAERAASSRDTSAAQCPFCQVAGSARTLFNP